MLAKCSNLRFTIENGCVTPTTATDAPILVYCSPCEEQRSQLVSQLLLDEHTLSSTMDPDETARLEFEPAHVAVILKRPDGVLQTMQIDDFGVASLGAFLFEDRLVIVQSDKTPLFQGGRPPFRCDSLRSALLLLIYHSIAQFNGHVKIIHQMSNAIEEHIAYSLGNKALSSMFSLQKSLVYYQSAIHSNHVLLNKLRLNAARIGFTHDDMEILEDIIVENEQCLKLVEIYSSILTGMSDARVSIISNNLAALMQKLTVISIVFMPLNILASMGGMSEWTLFTAKIPWPISYSIFMFILIVVGYITWLIIRKVGIQEAPQSRRRRARQEATTGHQERSKPSSEHGNGNGLPPVDVPGITQ